MISISLKDNGVKVERPVAPTLNLAALHRLADTIEAADRFDLGDFIMETFTVDEDDTDPTISRPHETPAVLIHNCKTAGCFAGWQNGLSVMDDPTLTIKSGDVEAAREALGLTEDEGEALFMGQSYDDVWAGIDSPFDIDAATAAMVLREIAAGTRTFGSNGDVVEGCNCWQCRGPVPT